MKKYLFILILVSIGFGNVINVLNINNETLIIVNNEIHIDYGLSYPVTYKFSLSQGLENLNAYRKYEYSQDWNLIDEKNHDDFFNGIEAVRFDYDENIAYVSVAFSAISDTIFIKIENNIDENVNALFIGACEYYDNRQAVVTITADDWADYCNEKFVQACQNFRSYNLWYSVAVITGWIWNQETWDDIQTQLDNGLIEVVSHSRTHPYTPYIDVEGEVAGSKQDIINNLNLLNHNRSGVNEYVYAWVAPFGDYDAIIDSSTSNAKYLVSRLFHYNENYFSNWNSDLYKFDPVGGSIELGNSDYWGSTDINELNTTFNNIVDSNGIYHLITHPNILDWDEDFTWNHLEYISNRKDIWYVGFGHLYLYRFISSTIQNAGLNIVENQLSSISNIMIYHNYPNPFNPITTIRYDLFEATNVNITIYDMMGRQVRNLVNTNQNSGYKSVIWNGTNDNGELVSAGMYFYSIKTNTFSQTRKMILLE